MLMSSLDIFSGSECTRFAESSQVLLEEKKYKNLAFLGYFSEGKTE